MTETITYTKDLSKKSKCPHCGANMQIQKIGLTQGGIEALRLASLHCIAEKKTVVHLPSIFPKAKHYMNFNKLKHFGFISMLDHSGQWKLEPKAFDFISGRAATHRWVKTFRNKIVEHSKDFVTVSEIKSTYAPEYWRKEFPYEIHESKISRVEEVQAELPLAPASPIKEIPVDPLLIPIKDQLA